MAILAIPYACLGAQLDRPKWDLQGKRLWRVAGLLPPCMQLQQSEAVSATWVLPELFGNTCRQHRMLEWIGPQRYARAPTLISARCALPKFPLHSRGQGGKTYQTPPFLLIPLSHQSALLPAGFRQKDQTQKAATGPFDREHLLMYLEKEALEQKDREDFVPFTGEKKGEDHRWSLTT